MKDLYRKIGMIAMSDLKGIGSVFFKKTKLNNSFLTSDVLHEIKDIIKSNNKHFDEIIISQAIDKAYQIIEKCSEENISIIDIFSEDYPDKLKEIYDSPQLIYCKGNLELLYNNILCIIGTREPNKNGYLIAEKVGTYFSQADWAICNGLAEGIDNFSIKMNGTIHGKIIGILAGGLNYNNNKTVMNKTAITAENTLEKGGLIISEFPPDKKEDQYSIINSCRIQAGISHGLILIQSSITGGSRFTFKTFCGTNRPIAVIHPTPLDYSLESYSANKEIIEKDIDGLVKFTSLKKDKIKTKTIFVMKSKNDYKTFENILVH